MILFLLLMLKLMFLIVFLRNLVFVRLVLKEFLICCVILVFVSIDVDKLVVIDNVVVLMV